MFEIDKAKFGAFVSALRKEKGLTQKELAARLFVSDKAVSKWEVGASIPDVSLLVPLGEQLGVTVTELLECRRMEEPQTMDAGQVEELVRTAITYQEEPIRRGSGSKFPFLIALAAGVVLNAALWLFGGGDANAIVIPLLGGIFGVYFWFFSPDRLPRYYDENKIYNFGDGPFRMNMMGVAFNNRNWPHIRRVGRLWCLFILTGYPLLQLAAIWFCPEFWHSYGLYVTLAVVLGGLFVPIVVVGRKYE